MAIISRKDLLDLLRPGIEELFMKEYAEFYPQTYIKEVDFGQDTIQVRDLRNNDGT